MSEGIDLHQPPLLFQKTRDLTYAQRVNREMYRRFMKLTKVYLMDRGIKDELYGENLQKTFNQGTSEPSYEIEMCFPDLPVWNPELTKHGINEKRDFAAYAFAEAFREAGVQAPYIGDHIEIEGERYKVMDTDPVDYFGNTQVGLTLRFVLVRVQAESIKAKPRTEQPGDIYPQSGLRAAMERSGSVSPQPAQNEQVTPPARGPSPVWPGTAAAAAPGRTLPVPPVPDDGAQLGAHDLGEDELGDDGE